MLRLMLHRHPCVAWNSESDYVVDYVGDDGRWPPLAEFYARLRRDYQYSNDRIFAGHKFTIDHGLDFPSLARSFLEQFRRREGDPPVVGATVHRHFHRLPFIWPDAKFIKITRDGRDVARSGMLMGWYGNLWAACDRWLEAEHTWDRLRATLTPDRFVDVRYEDLVSRPVEVLTRLCAFMGLAYDPVMLTYDRSTGYEYPDAKCAAQWKRKMSPAELRLVEARIGDELVRHGYELSGHPPLRVGPLRRCWLRLTDRVGRARHRVRKFGLSLVVGCFVGRRLGLRGLEERVWTRMNEVVEAGLKK